MVAEGGAEVGVEVVAYLKGFGGDGGPGCWAWVVGFRVIDGAEGCVAGTGAFEDVGDGEGFD